MSWTFSSRNTGFGIRAKLEILDHPPEVADLPDNGVGQPCEGFRIRSHLAPVAALQALRGQLDRG
jgi:hypothetical protein